MNKVFIKHGPKTLFSKVSNMVNGQVFKSSNRYFMKNEHSNVVALDNGTAPIVDGSSFELVPGGTELTIIVGGAKP